MTNSTLATVLISEYQVQVSLAMILSFVFFALIACLVKYRSLVYMRLVYALTIIFVLIPLVYIAKLTGDTVTYVIGTFFVACTAGNILFIRPSFVKSNFMYIVPVMIVLIFVYWAQAMYRFA
jgi:hypothetical protein